MKKFQISKGAEFATARLSKAGFSAFLVGGAVRDMVMGKAPHDFDIATSATPDEMLEIFKGVTTFETGVTHGTVGVFFEGETVEITTFRADGDYSDHRHPEKVSFSRELRDDLSRRDFTVNAMAYSKDTGLVDLFGGREDIEKKLIRCVGNPEKRFDEDALRILRALRFASVLGFEIEEETKKAIHMKKELLSFVSKERITEEIKKAVDGDAFLTVAREFYDVFELIFGNLEKDFGKSLVSAEKGTPRLAVLLSSVPDFEKGMRSLTLTRKEKDVITASLKIAKEFSCENETELKKLMSKNGKDRVLLALKVLVSKRGEESILGLLALAETLDAINPDTLMIKGRDVIHEGVPPSAEVGKMIDSLIDDVIEGKVENEREALLSALREKISKKY